MKFATYFLVSLSALVGVVAYAIQSREQFYPVILFLTNSKISFLVTGNMILALAVLVGKISKSLFLGNLRDAEIEVLLEKAKFSAFETCLALTIFRNELSAPILLSFGVLLFVKSFHWLAKSRFEYLEQVMPLSTWTYIRFSGLLVTLFFIDSYMAYSAAKYTSVHGKSVLMLFGFEFGLLVISLMNLSSRFTLFLIDNRFANGLPSKGLYVMIVDLFCEAMKCIIYVVFFFLLFSNYGLPIHIVREVWVAFHNFQRKFSSLMKYLRLTNNLDQRFENATPEEISAAGDCLICRESMDCGKKLPCSHVFHLDCLRMWLQHQQSCPLCRAEIPTDSSNLNRSQEPQPPNINLDHPAVEPNIPIPQPQVQVIQRNVDIEHYENYSDRENEMDSVRNPFNSNLESSDTNMSTSKHSSEIERSNRMVSLEIPNLFIMRSLTDVIVREATSIERKAIRTIKKNAVIFVMDITTVDVNDLSHMWFRVSGGWIRELSDDGSFSISLEKINSGNLLNQVSSIDSVAGSNLSKILGINTNRHSIQSKTPELDVSQKSHQNLSSSPYSRPSRKPIMKSHQRPLKFPSFSGDLLDEGDQITPCDQGSFETSNDFESLANMTLELQRKARDLNEQIELQMILIQKIAKGSREEITSNKSEKLLSSKSRSAVGSSSSSATVLPDNEECNPLLTEIPQSLVETTNEEKVSTPSKSGHIELSVENLTPQMLRAKLCAEKAEARLKMAAALNQRSESKDNDD